MRNKLHHGFRIGYPVATIAFYGPTHKLATKVAVSIFLTESDGPDFLERYFSGGEVDVRSDPAVGEQLIAFLKARAPRSTVVTVNLIIGCPHEEGIDYPEGTSCPKCPYWQRAATALHMNAFSNHRTSPWPSPRNCPSCGKPNRIPPKHLADTGRCGARKNPSPPMSRTRGGQPRGVRRNRSRQQSPSPRGFLGGMVWSVLDGRAARGPGRP